MLLRDSSDLPRFFHPPTTAETFSAFLAPPTHEIMRYQRWIVIVTLVVGVLTVDICARAGENAANA